LREDLQAFLNGGIYLVDDRIISLVVKDKPGNEGFHADKEDMLGKDYLFVAFLEAVFFCKGYKLAQQILVVEVLHHFSIVLELIQVTPVFVSIFKGKTIE